MKKDFFFLLITRALSGISAALAAVLLARGVGPGLFGVFGTVVSVTTTIVTFAGLGLPTLIAKHRATRSPLLGQTIGLNYRTLFLGTVIAAGVATPIARSQSEGLPALLLIVAALGLENLADSLLSVPIADQAHLTTALSILTRRLVLLGSMCLSVFADLDALWLYSAGYLAGSLLAVGINRSYCERQGVRSEGISDYRGRLSEAWPYALANGAVAARSLDTAIVAATVGSLGAGNYAAASRLTTPFYLVPAALTQVLMPHAAQASSRAVKRIAWKLSLVTLLCYLPIGLFAFISEDIVVMVLGGEYAGAGSVFFWTLMAMPVVALASPLGTLLQSQDVERFVGLNGVLFAFLSLGAMFAIGRQTGDASMVAVSLLVTFLCKCLTLLWRLLRLQDPPQL